MLRQHLRVHTVRPGAARTADRLAVLRIERIRRRTAALAGCIPRESGTALISRLKACRSASR
jgi:hypothetical protein